MIARTGRLLARAKSGLPRGGLVAWWDMAITTDAQHVRDLTGGGADLQLGSTAGTDATDPTLDGTRATLAGDYLISPTLAAVSMGGEWTAFLTALCDGTTGRAWSLSSAANNLNCQALSVNGANSIVLQSYKDPAFFTGTLATPGAAYTVYMIRSAGGTLTFARLDTGASTSCTNTNPVGTPRVGIGVIADAGLEAPVNSLKVLHAAIYSRALTDAEVQAARRYFIARGKTRGVTVT